MDTIGQEPSFKMLIINADDLGYDPRVSEGILEGMREGVVSSATLMVNTPFSSDAAKAAEGLPLGLHFNLARFSPCSKTFPKAHLAADGSLDERRAPELPFEIARDEALAQVERFEKLCGRKPTHVDVHKHLQRHPNVLKGLIAAAERKGLALRALNASMREEIRAAGLKCPDHFIGDAGAEPYWTFERFRLAIQNLSPGTTELMCHPGHAPSHLQSGYSSQREVELRTFASSAAKELLRQARVAVRTFANF